MAVGTFIGHGSAWLVAVVVGVALLRHLGGQRGRQRRRQQALVPPPGVTGQPTDLTDRIPAGWMADPFGHYDQRYWSGSAWTEHVTKAGVPDIDPPPGSARPEEPGAPIEPE